MTARAAIGLLLAALAGALLVALPCWLILRRARRGHERAMGERGWLLEREREGAARAAVGEERARIARELHDIVSHNVSVMIVQAGAAREVLTTLPAEASAALAAVEKAGRDTMTELRHLLGLLAPAPDGSETDQGTDLAPQPTLSSLGPLVDRIAFAGLPVEVRISGEARPLPSGIDVTAFRIVQEALTNALKHGAGGKAEVTIRYTARAVRVEVLTTGPSVLTGSGPSPGAEVPGLARGEGAGRGLLGLRQRVQVYGGELDARRRLGGGYRVRARIPVEQP